MAQSTNDKMKKFFLALYAQLTAFVPEIQYIRMWNDQLALVMAGRLELFQCPAAFIEFQSMAINKSTLGSNGIQILDPFIFKIHILYWQLDAMGGNFVQDATFEQNLDVYDLKDKVFIAIQKFQPGLSDTTTPVGSCIRIAEYQDYKHAGIYHYIQEYQTTMVDNTRIEPVGGSVWPEGNPGDPTNPAQIEENVTIEGSNDPSAPHVYTFTPQP